LEVGRLFNVLPAQAFNMEVQQVQVQQLVPALEMDLFIILLVAALVIALITVLCFLHLLALLAQQAHHP
jgi:hypothetical protein